MININISYIKALIYNDGSMMEILKAAQKLELPDWWVCAGFIRNKVWDECHSYSLTSKQNDIDVIFFDSYHTNEAYEKYLETILLEHLPDLPWSVKNQARMHVLSGFSPYHSSEDGIAHFPETPTSVGIKLSDNGELILTAPWGIEDLVTLTVRPTPPYRDPDKYPIYLQRIAEKNWAEQWPKLNILK